MRNLSSDDVRELLAGTWFGMALILELMIAGSVADRREVIGLLSRFERGAKPPRQAGLAALRKIIETASATDESSTGTSRRTFKPGRLH